MAKSYVKFEVSNEVVSKTYEALQLAKQSGTIRKGSNEVTKSVERGLASFVVIAGDVDPEEVVVHIPSICEQKKVPYSYVPSKTDLGKAIGLNVPCTAIAVENAGSAESAIKDIAGKVSGVSQAKSASEPKQEQKAEKEQKAPKPKHSKKQQQSEEKKEEQQQQQESQPQEEKEKPQQETEPQQEEKKEEPQTQQESQPQEQQ